MSEFGRGLLFGVGHAVGFWGASVGFSALAFAIFLLVKNALHGG